MEHGKRFHAAMVDMFITVSESGDNSEQVEH